jgi:hypothetical protein
MAQTSEDLGMYFQKADEWVRMEKIVPLGAQAKGVEGALIGIGPSTVAQYRGRTSPILIVSSRPLFRYVRAKDREEFIPRAVVFVRLEERKDSRELRIGKGTRVGFDKKKTTEAVVKSIGANVYTIQPAEPLQQGQYLLTYGSNPVGYDFAVN